MTVEQLIKDEAKLARKEGREEGRQEGLEEGETNATTRLNKLIECLIQDNRIDELKASITDNDLRNKLFKEYGIITS